MIEEQGKGETVREEEPEKKNKISVYRTPLFTKLYATNLRVSPTDVDFRIEFFFNEKIETEEELIFYSDALAMLTPEAAKKIVYGTRKGN